LYLLFGAALLTGSALRGAEFALAFGLGTIPLLWLAQQQLKYLKKRFKPTTLVRFQRSLAITAALLIAFRLWGTIPFPSKAPEKEAELPSCCH
jgi:sulfite exporter TauE/SafE